MVLEKLGESLRETLRKIAGASHISPELIKELVRDIQRALLQSDVNVRLALDLSKRIETRALDEKPPAGMTGREHVVRIVHQELVKALGKPKSLKLGPQKIMMVGLYGQGKTTTTGKIIGSSTSLLEASEGVKEALTLRESIAAAIAADAREKAEVKTRYG